MLQLIPDKRSFTYIEIIVVIVIVGLLAAMALPQFGTSKERTFDKEARLNLQAIQEAETTHKMEKGTYYPAVSSTGDPALINSNLKLGLPTDTTYVNWLYNLDTTVVGGEKATATRVGAGGRIWTILFPPGSSDIPACTGTGCP